MKYVAFFLGTLIFFFMLSVAHAGSPLFLPAGGQVMSCQVVQEAEAIAAQGISLYGFITHHALVIFLLSVSILSFVTGWLKVKMNAHKRRSIWKG
ncbi:MAG: hypothetical protein AAFU33_22905 [Bacteroidota bacterium]